MNDGRTRIYINWDAIRPKTGRDWARVLVFVAVGIAALALIAVIASTLLVGAAIVGAAAAAYLAIVNMFRRSSRSRDVGPYQGNSDA